MEITKEEKELLIKDLCERLPYGVIVDYKENEFEIPHWKITTIYPETLDGWIGYDNRVGAGSESGSRHFNIGEIKPYLRPLSSMTDEEREEYRKFSYYGAAGYRNNDYKEMVATPSFEKMDFLNAHHFDYRGLIEKELALEAPDGMYNFSDNTTGK